MVIKILRQETLISSRRGESGMVSAEFALGLIPISLMLTFTFMVAAMIAGYLQAQDMSRVVARQVSVGKDITEVVQRAERTLEGAKIVVKREGSRIDVDVQMSAIGPFLPVSASTSTLAETAW